jgi:hypothetical protein
MGEEHVRMNPRVIVVAALATLALAACSSGTKSDTPNSGSTSAPSATATASDATAAPGDTGSAPADLCASIRGLDTIGAEVVAETNDINAVISDSEKWDAPATVATLNETGQAMLDKIPAVTAYFETAASQADDPEVAAALVSMGDLYGTYFKNWAQAAVDATDVMSFAMGFLELTSTDEMTAVMSDATDAASTVSAYASANCR